MPAMMRLFIRLMQSLKEIADYCDLQGQVVKERGNRLIFQDQILFFFSFFSKAEIEMVIERMRTNVNRQV